VLLNYGELPDELAGALEQHLAGCEDCREELEAFRGLEERLATMRCWAFAESAGAVATAAR
jgi:anti-sigma factor RsiW